MLKSKKGKIIYSCFIATLLFFNCLLWPSYITGLETYAITNGKDVVCYVKGKDTATEVLNEVCSQSVQENATIKAVSSELNIKKEGKREDTITKEEAVEEVKTSSEMSVASVNTEVQTFKPDTTYKKDTDMLAGQAETISEGKDGEKEVTILNVSTNGETVSEEEVNEEILEEGEPDVVKKGTRGLPEGESWEEYEGYPVYRSGDDIVATAKSYIGKVEYVWGGKNLETGQGINVPYEEAQPGDILYFPGHYGMYIGNGKMVHASNPRTDVCIGDVAGRKLISVTRIIPKE